MGDGPAFIGSLWLRLHFYCTMRMHPCQACFVLVTVALCRIDTMRFCLRCAILTLHRHDERSRNMTQSYTLGEYLAACRQLRGWTMSQAASQAVGIAASNISKIERNLSMPKMETVDALARGLGCPWWDDTQNQAWLVQVAWALTGDPAFASGRASDADPILTQAQAWSEAIDSAAWPAVKTWSNLHPAFIGLARGSDRSILVPLFAWMIQSSDRLDDLDPEKMTAVIETSLANQAAAQSQLPNGNPQALRSSVDRVNRYLAALNLSSVDDLARMRRLEAFLMLGEADQELIGQLIERIKHQ